MKSICISLILGGKIDKKFIKKYKEIADINYQSLAGNENLTELFWSDYVLEIPEGTRLRICITLAQHNSEISLKFYENHCDSKTLEMIKSILLERELKKKEISRVLFNKAQFQEIDRHIEEFTIYDCTYLDKSGRVIGTKSAWQWEDISSSVYLTLPTFEKYRDKINWSELIGNATFWRLQYAKSLQQWFTRV